MDASVKLKICVTCVAAVLGCACVYLLKRRKSRLYKAIDAFQYLIIKTVTTEEDSEDVVNELRRRSTTHNALGFDCEWVTAHRSRQPVALVQLSSYDGYCGLFRLNCMNTMPKSLKKLLQDGDIYKVGVDPANDGKYLSQDYDVQLRSTIDIRHIAELCGHSVGGLAHLSESILGVVLDKHWKTRCSDWEAVELSDIQTQYAAADAHVAIRIFVDLLNQYDKGTLLSWFYRDQEEDIWTNLDTVCWKYVDLNYKTQHNNMQKEQKTSRAKELKEPTLEKKKYSIAKRSKPLYHNCFLQAPDGELLCTCDNKKALWYVEKKLADVVKEDPLTVRLRFEPAARSVGDVGRYYQLKKENMCVVCGSTNSYIRKNVVPREYRKYFPELMKDHSSHDVLLLCTRCHQRSNARDQPVRDMLANMCAAPIASHTTPKYIEDIECKKVRSAARALLHQSRKHLLPEDRRQHLEQVLLRHYSHHHQLTEELLKEAADLTVVVENVDFESHGLKVVEYFSKREGGILRLEELWREHFLAAMSPKFMPELWSVKHNEERLRVRWTEGRLSESDLKLIGITNWL